MAIRGLSRFALSLGAAATFLAGCGGSQAPIAPPNPLPQSRTIATHSTKDKLLYISDEGTNDVYVYSLSKDRLVATLTGFSEPRGVCLNRTGDIWITNAGNSSLLEYAPGGAIPIAALNDAGESPVDCSVDTTSGELGVSNIVSGYGPGSLSLYRNAVGVPAIVPAFAHTYNDAYDPTGNLFIDGVNDEGWFQFGELARGERTVANLTLKGATIGDPINVQYADGQLALGDERGYSQDSIIYQVSVTGTTATVIGKTRLHDANVIAFFIARSQVFCLISTRVGAHVAIYDYPAGGKPTGIIKISGLSMPVGLAVTTAK